MTLTHFVSPQVMTIQACQIPAQRDAQLITGMADPAIAEAFIESTPEKNQQRNYYVVLERPNTVLLLATIYGGTAIRGAFTGALAKEFSQADGVTNLFAIHNKAVSRMKKEDPTCISQIPQLTANTDKDLILPESKIHMQ